MQPKRRPHRRKSCVPIIARDISSPAKKHDVRSGMKSAFDAKICYYQRWRKRVGYINGEIYAAGREIFSTDAALVEWLCAPVNALGGKVPLQFMRTAKGRRHVLQIIRAIEHGVYL